MPIDFISLEIIYIIMKRPDKPFNLKVIAYSLVALACIALAFAIDWIFLVPAAVLMWLNQRELYH
jgi:hypothetical protein